MNQTIKMIVIALSAAVVGGGLVIGGMKLAAPSEKAAKRSETRTASREETGPNFLADGEEQAPAPAGVGVKVGVGATAGGQVNTNTAPSPTAPKQTAPAPAGGSATDAQLRALLTSSAWCSFSYNQYSGSSSTTRYVFSSNGTFSTGGRAESYSSGQYGTVSGQTDSSGGGQWKISNLRLYVASDETGGQFVDADASLTQNSNGYPIITAGGVEYSQCN